MLKEARHNKILDIINSKGNVKTSDLCEMFNTSRQTIHNDLDTLDYKGKLRKVFGGAIKISKTEEPSVEIRKIKYKNDKDSIGRVAVEFINEKDTIFLDVSTTVETIIPHLKKFNKLSIVTNSIEIAHHLKSYTNFDLIMIGGFVRVQDLACGGAIANEILNNIYVDKSFFGLGGISIEAGFTDYNFTDSDVRKIMIKNSNETFALFDKSKIGVVGISKFANINEIDKLISYDVDDKKFLKYIEKNAIHFIDAKKYEF